MKVKMRVCGAACEQACMETLQWWHGTIQGMTCVFLDSGFLIEKWQCGSSRRRRELRARYQDKAWIDAFSKSDMLEEELQRASSYRQQLQAQQQLEVQEGGERGDSHLQGELQHQQGRALSEEERQHQTVDSHQQLAAPRSNSPAKPGVAPDALSLGGGSLQTWAGSHEGVSKTLEDVEEVFGDASEVAARLPHALAVSSKTEQGIPELQAMIISMFSELAAREAIAAVAAAAASTAHALE